MGVQGLGPWALCLGVWGLGIWVLSCVVRGYRFLGFVHWGFRILGFGLRALGGSGCRFWGFVLCALAV